VALTATLLINNFNNVDLSSYPTASISPTAGRWLIVDVASDATVAPNAPTLSGGGFTYTQEATILGAVGGGTTRRCTRFYTWTGASPGSFAITIDFATQTQEMVEWIVYELDGVNLSDPFVQSVTAASSGTTPTVTLAAFASGDNRPLSFCMAGTTFTSVDATEIGAGAGVDAPSRSWWNPSVADTTPEATLSVSAEWKMLASEINSASAGGFVVDPFGMAGFFGA
jgi:hypothetical protein